MVIRITTRKPATSPAQEEQATPPLEARRQAEPRGDFQPRQPRGRHPHQTLGQQLVSQHRFGKFIGVQEFLHPGIKKKPAQNDG